MIDAGDLLGVAAEMVVDVVVDPPSSKRRRRWIIRGVALFGLLALIAIVLAIMLA